MVKNLPASAGVARDADSIPESGRSPRGNGNLFQYSCLESFMGRGARQAPIFGVAKNLHLHTLLVSVIDWIRY